LEGVNLSWPEGLVQLLGGCSDVFANVELVGKVLHQDGCLWASIKVFRANGENRCVFLKVETTRVDVLVVPCNCVVEFVIAIDPGDVEIEGIQVYGDKAPARVDNRGCGLFELVLAEGATGTSKPIDSVDVELEVTAIIAI